MRELYCKALVYAAGGGRLARDWIAGCSALTAPNQALLYIALQYNATEADVHHFRGHLLGRLVRQEEEESPEARGRNESKRATSSGAAVAASVSHTTTSHAYAESEDSEEEVELRRRIAELIGASSARPAVGEVENKETEKAVADKENTKGEGRSASVASPSPQQEPSPATGSNPSSSSSSSSSPLVTSTSVATETSSVDDTATEIDTDAIERAEQVLLSNAPEVRCFLYDAMMASLFHCHSDFTTVEEARRRITCIGVSVFGLPAAEVTALWRIVEAEMFVKKEKVRTLGQPWVE